MTPTCSGPIIGIMTACKSNGTIAGNGSLFIEIQKKLISLNGISFVFTIEGVRDDKIIGYMFSTEKNGWVKGTFSFPNLVYNRIPFRKSEQRIECQRFFSLLKEKKIPFFNPCFIDKYTLNNMLENHPILQNFLPKTVLIQTKEGLLSLLEEQQCLYLKPSQSSKGKGIFRLKLIPPSQIQLEGIKKHEHFNSFDHFWEKRHKTLLEKNYLAQEEVDAAEYNGDRFDFRILAHRDQDDYHLTGVGIRQSQDQDITTHLTAGGSLLPYVLLQTNEHDHFIHTVIPLIGGALSEQLGYFGEFSIDAGVSKSGKYFIYEVNSKPMSFDEREIEEKKIEQLCNLFVQLTNF